ncbi:MAG: glycosyltransferase family 2 protein [Elusimicrobiota bacterium]
MISISIIGHNEEKNIGQCLESIKWADELIFVDCASTDKTVEIVKKYTTKIFYKENNPNLNVNKQFGIEQCNGDWILYLDPDEIITDELRNEILSVISHRSSVISGYFIPRKNFYFGRFLKFGGKYPDYQLRLFKKGFAKFPCEHVHERIYIDSKIAKLKSAILHYPYQNISDMLKKSDFYTSRKAEYMFKQNKKHSILFIISFSKLKFFRSFILKFGFLDGFVGLIVAVMDSYNEFISFLKLKELQNEKK